MVDEIGKETIIPQKFLDFRREIKPEELDLIRKEQLPFSSVVRAIDAEGEICFQPLKQPDPEEVE